jgi:hypothetical protein
MSNRLTLLDPKVWNAFVKPGEVTEVRIPYKWPESGYFDDHALFCEAVQQASKKQHDGIYFTIQVIDPRLLGRAFNRIKQSKLTTSDRDVLFYRWLPIDLDPVRPAGISSSDAELQAALELREIIADHVVNEMGFVKPIKAMSGNGGHLLFRLPDLPAKDENKNMIKSILHGLAKEFDNDIVKIDQSVYNPSQLWKLYGSQARKGDALPAGPYREARPHRQSYIDDLGE